MSEMMIPGNNEEEIRCRHIFTIYPKSFTGIKDGESIWMVVKYENDDGEAFTATGTNLPTLDSVYVKLYGSWKKSNKKYEKSFEVSSYHIILPTTEKGFVDYLASLKCGIGKVKAKQIYKKFGEEVWSIIENEPGQLTSIKGISEKKVSKLLDKLTETVIERKLTKLFAGTINVSAQKVKSIKDKFGSKNLIERITENPYQLCNLEGFNFISVDKLGLYLKVEADHFNRLYAAADHLLKEASAHGHVCVPKEAFRNELFTIVNRPFEQNMVSYEKLNETINQMCKLKLLAYSNNMIYNIHKYREELGIAEKLTKMCLTEVNSLDNQWINKKIIEYEESIGISLAVKQKEAVRLSLENKVSIITGGPGTGKSTVIRALLWIYKKKREEEEKRFEPILLAPTGRASRRMEEATGYNASTIHSAIGFAGREDDFFEEIDGDLFIIDETSMMDQFIANALLKVVPDEASIVFVGDPNQLPSIGCGNFLADIIRAKYIPTTKLDTIFRQAEGNAIIENANKICNGKLDLNYSSSNFVLVQANTGKEIFSKACQFYLSCIKKYGVENVILLNGYRSKSDLNVDAFNQVIQRHYNPEKTGEVTMKNIKHIFRVGDRVMQMTNTDGAKNGDVGTIVSIEEWKDPKDPDSEETLVAMIRFQGYHNIFPYTAEKMKELDLAYCTTIHKSQGSEYQIVILIASEQHKFLNNRATIYTGCTRAKENIVILTEKSCNQNAFERAILNDKSEVRHTLLAQRLYFSLKK